ncbi:Threonine dehydratase, catabolic [Caenispirillum salinarum AK4]|uniref:Threonine dehydratase, catabolic n=1 Tax=Caenispirillum salinarum AK4 TaxID=1238182 RepID=K9HM24_9PROT|nr:threonine/serine dehydratase [Caenispirillum salinarum]EKV31403.1 Threonine dehydratase, catabolic [Caenispirillum salinarum AK4]
MTDALPLPTFTDVEAAAARLAGVAVRTPLLESPLLNERLDGRVLIKAEPLQRTGSFKFRGAYNALASVPEHQRRRGVVAFSSGNHGQGVAAAARLFDVPAVIVMPSDAPAIKIAATRAQKAEVVTYDRWTESREDIGARLCEDMGATLVKPFDEPAVIAGQGTMGLEIAVQAAEAGAHRIDRLIAPFSGGGMLAGLSLALERLSPHTVISSAEPEGFDDMARSLATGERLRNQDPAARSLCDALMAPMPGELTFPIIRPRADRGFAVSDAEAKAAMAFAFHALKLVVEPGGAVALAAVLSGKVDCRGRTTVVVCSGGNVDPAVYAEALAEGPLPF